MPQVGKSVLLVAACAIQLGACGQPEISRSPAPDVTKTITADDAYQMVVEGDYDSALAAITPILRKDPHNIAAIKVRAECFYAKKQYSQAIADLNQVIEREPSRGSYFLRAQIYQSSARPDLAEADYRRVVALDLKKVESKSDQAPPLKTRIIHLIYLANSLEEQAKWQEAINLYSQILTLDRNDQNSLHGRARAQKELERAKARAKKA